MRERERERERGREREREGERGREGGREREEGGGEGKKRGQRGLCELLCLFATRSGFSRFALAPVETHSVDGGRRARIKQDCRPAASFPSSSSSSSSSSFPLSLLSLPLPLPLLPLALPLGADSCWYRAAPVGNPGSRQ